MEFVDVMWIAVGYLAGSIPFALLIGRMQGVDIRTQGSGNVGATNCGRVCGRKWGIICFVLDVLKGLGPVLGTGLAMGYAATESLPAAEAWKWLAVGAAAVLGHVFPIWLGFKGGKGVATAAGVLLGFWPIFTIPAIGGIIVWLTAIAIWRYVGLASSLAAFALPIFVTAYAYWKYGSDDISHGTPFIIVSTLLALLIIWRHRGNLARVRAGTEPKLRQRHK